MYRKSYGFLDLFRKGIDSDHLFLVFAENVSKNDGFLNLLTRDIDFAAILLVLTQTSIEEAVTFFVFAKFDLKNTVFLK